MGAAGDMLAAALLELHPNADDFICRLNNLGLPDVVFTLEPSIKCGIKGSHFSVKVHGNEEGEHNEHEHSHGHDLHDIEHILSHTDIPEPVKADVLSVYKLLAQAESHVHGTTVEQIHFHELGQLDAIADITAVCLLLHELKPEKIIASPINVGSSQVKCAHGILPVPAPATAYLLQGLPSYGSEVAAELCTPTGAALLKYFAQDFGQQPVMQVNKIGYGCGKKDFSRANCLRAMIGESSVSSDSVVELQCNLDDMTPEAIGFAMEQLLNAGALDVYTIPIGMKKSRPGVLLSCMCHEEQRDNMVALLFKHTSTIGIRENVSRRYVLDRNFKTVESPYGEVRVKSVSGWGVNRQKAEYEDLARIARKQGISLHEAEASIIG
jgi:hypothetical protein